MDKIICYEGSVLRADARTDWRLDPAPQISRRSLQMFGGL